MICRNGGPPDLSLCRPYCQAPVLYSLDSERVPRLEEVLTGIMLEGEAPRSAGATAACAIVEILRLPPHQASL
jgi:hypothetical protein